LGLGNTAIGTFSLFSVSTGNFNTAVGAGSLDLNLGDLNTATGAAALLFNTTGTQNTAVGTAALEFNGTGSGNTANGAFALESNTGDDNTAVGDGALQNNTTGSDNTALGINALNLNTTGGGNIALGNGAGFNLTTGSNNIDIGNVGVTGDFSTIRIGTTQGFTHIAGIFGDTVSGGTAVYIDSFGQLGTSTSSARFKRDIHKMEGASEVLFALRPVTFRYNKDIDPAGTSQFGLVAEEVEKVSPDLVVRDKEGKPYSVRYEQVNAMLLNEFLKEHRKVEQQRRDFEAALAQQQKQIDTLTATLQKVSAQLQLNKTAPQTVLNNQ
jgi:hypothetical protein